jgi:hypothetical protein
VSRWAGIGLAVLVIVLVAGMGRVKGERREKEMEAAGELRPHALFRMVLPDVWIRRGH